MPLFGGYYEEDPYRLDTLIDEQGGGGSLPGTPPLPPAQGPPEGPLGNVIPGGTPRPELPTSTDPTADITGRNRDRGGGDGYGAGPTFNIPGAPTFIPPEFRRPTMDDAYNEPGYQFRQRAGNEALERSAAARGVLRTGGTLQDLVEYGQNFAANEYGQVFNRALAGYDRTYQGARDAFAPRLAEWNQRALAERQRAMAAWEYATRPKGGGGGQAYIPDWRGGVTDDGFGDEEPEIGNNRPQSNPGGPGQEIPAAMSMADDWYGWYN